MVQCRTRERNDGTTYKICYDEKKKSEKKSSPNISIMPINPQKEIAEQKATMAANAARYRTLLNELTKILTDEPPSYLKRHGEMFVIRDTFLKRNKYLNDRTPLGNPIKITERVSYKPRSAPISMLVMPKNGINKMVNAGKKKGADFTFALKKLEAGIDAGTITIKKIKTIPTSEWAAPAPAKKSPEDEEKAKRRADLVKGTNQKLVNYKVPRVKVSGANFTSRTKLGTANKGPQSGFLKVKSVRKSNTIQRPAAKKSPPDEEKAKRRAALVKGSSPAQSRGASSLRSQYGGRGVPKGNMIFDSWGEVGAFDSSIGGF